MPPRLTIASAPPAPSVSPGRPATGCTSSDDPTTRSRSASGRELLGALDSRRRQELAEHDDSRLQYLPTLRARRQRQRRDRVLHRHAGSAADAFGLAQRAVHLDDVARAGALVQAVDVLRDHRADPASLLELGERAVPVVRLGLAERIEPKRIELPDPRGIAAERLDVRDLHRVVPRPDASGRAEVRESPTRC